MNRGPSFGRTVLLIAIFMIVSGCGASLTHDQHSIDEARRLEATFPQLETLHVIEFQDESGCHSIEYVRGAYSDSVPPGQCYHFQATPKPFDATTSADFQAVQQAFKSAGVAVRYSNLEFDDSGSVSSGFLEVGCASPCQFGRYQYASDGRFDPDLQGADVTTERLSDHWMWYEGQD